MSQSAACAAAVPTSGTASSVSGLTVGGGASGGQVSRRSDSIPALLSSGEFVMTARATRRNRRLLELMNRDFVPPSFARGGFVPAIMHPETMTPDRSPPRRAPAPAPNITVTMNIGPGTQRPEMTRSISQLRGRLLAAA